LIPERPARAVAAGADDAPCGGPEPRTAALSLWQSAGPAASSAAEQTVTIWFAIIRCSWSGWEAAGFASVRPTAGLTQRRRGTERETAVFSACLCVLCVRSYLFVINRLAFSPGSGETHGVPRSRHPRKIA
jgi:hypothetical protein